MKTDATNAEQWAAYLSERTEKAERRVMLVKCTDCNGKGCEDCLPAWSGKFEIEL